MKITLPDSLSDFFRVPAGTDRTMFCSLGVPDSVSTIKCASNHSYSKKFTFKSADLKYPYAASSSFFCQLPDGDFFVSYRTPYVNGTPDNIKSLHIFALARPDSNGVLHASNPLFINYGYTSSLINLDNFVGSNFTCSLISEVQASSFNYDVAPSPLIFPAVILAVSFFILIYKMFKRVLF